MMPELPSTWSEETPLNEHLSHDLSGFYTFPVFYMTRCSGCNHLLLKLATFVRSTGPLEGGRGGGEVDEELCSNSTAAWVPRLPVGSKIAFLFKMHRVLRFSVQI